MRALAVAVAVTLSAGTGAALAACGGSPSPGGLTGPVVVDLDAPPPARLSAFQLFAWDAATGFAFNDRVV